MTQPVNAYVLAADNPSAVLSLLRQNPSIASEQEANAGTEEVDPEFKRRIDELAAREDFQSEEAQNELRNLVMDAIQGSEIDADGREVRRRTD